MRQFVLPAVATWKRSNQLNFQLEEPRIRRNDCVRLSEAVLLLERVSATGFGELKRAYETGHVYRE